VDAVRFEDRDGARWITLDRPPVNVLDIATIQALDAALAPLADRSDLKAVVLRSAIPRTFSAGVDVRDHTRERVSGMLASTGRRLRAPGDGGLRGRRTCLGGGCELVASATSAPAYRALGLGQPIDVGCFPPLRRSGCRAVAPRAAAS
jgi:cyclohexa-1,5-dienecarbonyl-CoA hydratase